VVCDSLARPSSKALLFSIGKRAGMDYEHRVVRIEHANHLKVSAALSATHDQELVIADLLGEWGFRATHDRLCLIAAYAVLGDVVTVQADPPELHPAPRADIVRESQRPRKAGKPPAARLSSTRTIHPTSTRGSIMIRCTLVCTALAIAASPVHAACCYFSA